MRKRFGKHERTIIIDVIIFSVGGAKVDARTTFQGSKESRSHVGADPAGNSVEFVARHQTRCVVVVVIGHS